MIPYANVVRSRRGCDDVDRNDFEDALSSPALNVGRRTSDIRGSTIDNRDLRSALRASHPAYSLPSSSPPCPEPGTNAHPVPATISPTLTTTKHQ